MIPLRKTELLQPIVPVKNTIPDPQPGSTGNDVVGFRRPEQNPSPK
jgi:hypothetical protein